MGRMTALFLLGLFCLPAMAQVLEQRHISVNGVAEIEAVPDIAEVTVDLSETAPTLVDAKARVDKQSARLIAELSKTGIHEDDIQSSKMQIYPEYDWNNGQRTYRGQRVQRTVKATLRDITRYGDLMQALADGGVTQMSEPQLKFSKQDAIYEQALQKALQQARIKAAAMAKELDAGISAVFSISEVSQGVSPMMDAMPMQARAAKAEFIVGKQAVQAQVQVIFLLGNE